MVDDLICRRRPKSAEAEDEALHPMSLAIQLMLNGLADLGIISLADHT